MFKINDNYLKLPGSYLFSTIGKKVKAFQEAYSQWSENYGVRVSKSLLVDKDGVRSSGGYIITPMPDATEEEISKVEQSIFKAGAISKMLDNKGETRLTENKEIVSELEGLKATIEENFTEEKEDELENQKYEKYEEII